MFLVRFGIVLYILEKCTSDALSIENYVVRLSETVTRIKKNFPGRGPFHSDSNTSLK